MADGTHIEWTDATWNPVTGCSIVSPGCTNCYAMKLAGTRLKHHPSRAGLTVDCPECGKASALAIDQDRAKLVAARTDADLSYIIWWLYSRGADAG